MILNSSHYLFIARQALPLAIRRQAWMADKSFFLHSMCDALVPIDSNGPPVAAEVKSLDM